MLSICPKNLIQLQERLSLIEQSLQYGFQNKLLLIQAFTHRSFLNEQRTGESERSSQHHRDLDSNERLEFLGDSILNILVSRFLFERFPTSSEGDLSRLRAQIVDAQTCAQNLEQLGLKDCLLMGKGQRMSQDCHSLHADLFEAILGALYLDGGWPATERFFWDHFLNSTLAICDNPQRNWKADLQDLAQKQWQITPSYQVLKEEGPGHTKIFEIGVYLGKHLLAAGLGTSKKLAQYDAAHIALVKLEEQPQLWHTLGLLAKEAKLP